MRSPVELHRQYAANQQQCHLVYVPMSYEHTAQTRDERESNQTPAVNGHRHNSKVSE